MELVINGKMNKIYTQSGIEIIACGNEGSPIRCKDQFDITFPKLLEKMQSDYYQKSTTEEWELEDIAIYDKVDKSLWRDLFRAVRFYFNECAVIFDKSTLPD